VSWINLGAQIQVPITLINTAGKVTRQEVTPWHPIFWCFCHKVRRLLNLQSGDWKLDGFNTGSCLGYKTEVMLTRWFESLTKKVPSNHLVQEFAHVLFFSGIPISHITYMNLSLLLFLLPYLVLRVYNSSYAIHQNDRTVLMIPHSCKVLQVFVTVTFSP